MRPIENPPNPYATQEVDWLGPPPVARVQVFEETARSVLVRNDSPDLSFRYSVNPYRGCLHACAYCYARQGHEYLGFGAGTDFETRIVVKSNAPECLKAEFDAPAWKGELVALSGDTDCYQPLEACYRLTRRCLEICLDYRNPVGIVTKSALIRRDLPILKDLARKGLVHVAISLAFLDPEVQQKVEPGAPLPRHRLEALRILASEGIPTSVLLAPVIPGLNDHEIAGVLEAAAEAGASSAHHLLLRLPGSVRDVFFQRIAAEFPDRRRRIESRLREVREGSLSDARFFHRHRGQGTYWEAITNLFELHRIRLGLSKRPHPEPRVPFSRPSGDQLELFP